MWSFLSRLIIRSRFLFLFLVLAASAFMAYKSQSVRISYLGSKVLPVTDSSFVYYRQFRATFGEDGAVMVLGLSSPSLYTLSAYNDWYKLSTDIKNLKGVNNVISTARFFTINKDTSSRKFKIGTVPAGPLSSQHEVDSIKTAVHNLPFYEGFLYNQSNDASLMAISLDQKVLNSELRTPLVHAIIKLETAFGNKNHLKVHLSGMPYIRSILSEKVSRELALFLGLSILATSFILFLFFRSIYPVLFSLLVVVIGVIWSFGIMVLFGYQITLLTAIIPSLVVIIGIPNSTLLLNRYHAEFKLHGNKGQALETAIERIGFTTLIANLTTAIGFGVFFYTRSQILGEFGVVAFLSIMCTYLLSLILIPVIFSFLPAPDKKRTVHLENAFLKRILDAAFILSSEKRKWVYGATLLLIIVGFAGIGRIEVNGYIVDDLPKKDPIYEDLKFFENNFKGIMPFEISVDTHHRNGVQNLNFLAKLDELERIIDEYPIFSKAVSINQVLKFSRQAFYNGNKGQYQLPTSDEISFLAAYAGKSFSGNSLLKNYIDSASRTARMSFQMADVGSEKMNKLLVKLKPRIDSLLPPSKYTVNITGSSIIFIKGANYLVTNLFESLALAIFLIAIIMLFLFKTFRMVLISLLPNLIPLIMTAGIMGYAGILLKPSTILVFSIAFGLASDQTIYFLTRYRLDLRTLLKSGKSISNELTKELVLRTLRETGVSMIYAAVILFVGFSIFDASEFGGDVTLGILVSLTLIFAIISNLVLLPSLLLSAGLKKEDERE